MKEWDVELVVEDKRFYAHRLVRSVEATDAESGSSTLELWENWNRLRYLMFFGVAFSPNKGR